MHTSLRSKRWLRNTTLRRCEALSSYYRSRQVEVFLPGMLWLCGSFERFLTARSFSRLALGMLLLVTFASVCLWLKSAPIDVNEGELPDTLDLVTRSVAEAPKSLPHDNSMAATAPLFTDPSFTAKVRLLAKSLLLRKIVLTTTNSGFLDFTENMLMSIQQVGIHPEVVVIAEDAMAYEVLLNHSYGLHVMKPPNAVDTPKEALNYGTANYTKLVNRRPSYVLEFIQQGFEVFFCDSDTFWFNDPFPYFSGDQYDVAFMRDYRRVFNAGVGFYRPTNRTEYFLRLWVWVLETQPKVRYDQDVLNYITSSKISPDLKVRSLSFHSFPTCKTFCDWDNRVCKKVTRKTAVFHAAFIPDHANKKYVFENCKLWLVNK
ncbi:UDP-D-xylose:L-fucose alpha-1,3-D-xylosyltransferase MGP4-like [Acanthaster planci]|uniref:UDP-D-xylose:L-fucose alpha-1,3-D-xylosyltransferase MGP4-like n=1 Tax=Acanthaster planci TaxID=133434 RepID=A0A8B7Z957_ACAPL|nr:UDP-D-xylose:L-fucose alpha-1,3-D-xylosyltransferase MGP4-like [Acanthaster planci]